MTEDERRAALAAVVRRGSRPGYLARACLLVAKGEYPRLDPTVSLAEIERLSARLREAAGAGGSAPWRALAEVLCREEGFRGAEEDYGNPDNSYLNRVLARRHGLPILLSVVWIEAARGAGIPARGVNLPGHFIVSVGAGGRATLVDPFAGGHALTRDDALQLARVATGNPTLRADEAIRACAPRLLVQRVLANLAEAYERRGDDRRLLRVLEDRLALCPDEPRLLAQRGEVRARCGDVEGGLVDLNVALCRLPCGEDFERVHESARVLARLRESDN